MAIGGIKLNISHTFTSNLINTLPQNGADTGHPPSLLPVVREAQQQCAPLCFSWLRHSRCPGYERSDGRHLFPCLIIFSARDLLRLRSTGINEKNLNIFRFWQCCDSRSRNFLPDLNPAKIKEHTNKNNFIYFVAFIVQTRSEGFPLKVIPVG